MNDAQGAQDPEDLRHPTYHHIGESLMAHMVQTAWESAGI